MNLLKMKVQFSRWKSFFGGKSLNFKNSFVEYENKILEMKNALLKWGDSKLVDDENNVLRMEPTCWRSQQNSKNGFKFDLKPAENENNQKDTDGNTDTLFVFLFSFIYLFHFSKFLESACTKLTC